KAQSNDRPVTLPPASGSTPARSPVQSALEWISLHRVIAAIVVLVLLALILYVLFSRGSGEAPIEEPTPQGFLVAFLLI
ncbi:MAG TPA: hypothetical protein VIX58_08120, partial [Anaerolineae bacterium]